MRVRITFTLCALLAVLAAPAAVQAGDWMITPFGGFVFGGDLSANTDGLGRDEKHGVYGLDLGYMGDGAFGFEVDFGYSPDFFGGDDAAVPDNNLTSLMGNLVLSAHFGDRGRLYVSGGGGLLKSRVNSTDDFFDVSRNDFGVDAGAGVLLPVGDRLGLRGDVRYFRNVGDPEPDNEFDIDFGSFDFWRATAGLTLRF
jgi:hypothetical protein